MFVKEHLVARAHQLCRERAWRDACTEFAATTPTGLAAADLEAWAVASHLVGQVETAGLRWTDAHQAWLDAGEVVRAVRCAFWFGLTLVQRGDHVRGNAWFARAARVLESEPTDIPERAYLLVPRALQAMDDGRSNVSLAMFEEVAAAGDTAADRDLATLGRLGQGQSLVLLGEAARGTAMLDDAMLAVTNDEVSPLVAGLAYCAVIIACEQVFDLRRAQQWTAALSAWCGDQQGIRPYRGQCLVHRAELLQLRGKWEEAMAEIRAACQQLVDPPDDPVQGMAYYRLGEMLRLRGQYTQAEDAYRRANRWGHSVQPGMALLRLAQGRLDDALAALGRVVGEEHHPGQQVRVLRAYIDVAAAAGEPATARTALDRLTALAQRFASPQLTAICDHARGVVLLAEGNPAGAVPSLQAAKAAWVGLDAPDEVARSAMYLGAAYHGLGDHGSARLEWDTAGRRFAETGAVTDLRRLDELAGAREPGGITAREAEILTHVATGETNRQIADRLGISEHTVRRHLQNIFAKLDLPSRAAASTWAHQHHLLPARHEQ